MDRRAFLGMGLSAAGLAAWPGRTAWAQAGKPPPQARDGEVRITDIKTYNVGRVLVQVTTDAGVDGWGEISVIPAALALAGVETFRPLLLGVNPTRIEHIWQMLYRAQRNVRGGIGHVAVIAGVDIALWDLLGKLVKQPVYALLGGAARDSLRFYPNATAYKCTTQNLHGMVEGPAMLDPIVADLQATRQRLGPKGAVMMDGHGKFTATVALELCRRIESLGVLFFEEVVPPENNADLVKVKRATSVPLAAGERMSTIWPFRQVLEDKSVDVLNADIVEVGGISQMHKLAGIAELYDLPLAPHSTHGPIGLSASLHVCAAINNFLIHEAYEHAAGRTAWLTGLAWPTGESFGLPPGPGLGITVDPDGLKDAVAQATTRPARGVDKAYFLGDGSVADR